MTEVTLRPVTEADEAFLRDVYGSTRAEELALTPWSEEQKAAFVAMQFAAQTAYYREVYPGAAHDVIVVDGRDAGRLYVARDEHDIRVVDVSLLPEFRARGVGTQLLTAILAEAAAGGQRVTIHVGFAPVEDLGVYLRMECAPVS
jgi:GNAT superfamily N-acetyltransferase